MDPQLLRKLLAKFGIIGADGDNRWDVFDAVDAAPFLASLNRQVSAVELQEELSLSRSQFELSHAADYSRQTFQPMGTSRFGILPKPVRSSTACCMGPKPCFNQANFGMILLRPGNN